MALLLQIYSHAHSPPLTPFPKLKYDLRKITNPPKQMRTSYDGRSKRLREFMCHDKAFMATRERAERDIMEVAERLIEEWRVGSRSDEVVEGDGKRAVGELQADESRGGADNEMEDERVEYDDPSDFDAFDGPVLRVSCFCAVGRHRSVAFAEELACVKWPREWDVQVIHRDVDQSRQVGKFGRNGKERKGERWRRSWPS